MHSQRRWKFPTINLVDEIAEELSKVSERNFTLRTKSVRLMIFSSRRDLTIWTFFILFLLFFKGRNFKTAQKILLQSKNLQKKNKPRRVLEPNDTTFQCLWSYLSATPIYYD